MIYFFESNEATPQYQILCLFKECQYLALIDSITYETIKYSYGLYKDSTTIKEENNNVIIVSFRINIPHISITQKDIRCTKITDLIIL